MTEDKISKFAENVSTILNLKPSVAFSRREPKQDYRPSSEMKTLFFWHDWYRFIKYRSLLLKKFHVSTAVRHGAMKNMDPEIVVHFAENDGRLFLHRRGQKELSENEKQLFDALDQTAKHFQSPALKKIPVFQPDRYGVHELPNNWQTSTNQNMEL